MYNLKLRTPNLILAAPVTPPSPPDRRPLSSVLTSGSGRRRGRCLPTSSASGITLSRRPSMNRTSPRRADARPATCRPGCRGAVWKNAPSEAHSSSVMGTTAPAVSCCAKTHMPCTTRSTGSQGGGRLAKERRTQVSFATTQDSWLPEPEPAAARCSATPARGLGGPTATSGACSRRRRPTQPC